MEEKYSGLNSVCLISSTYLMLLAVFEPWGVVMVEVPHWHKYSRLLKCVFKSVLERQVILTKQFVLHKCSCRNEEEHILLTS